MKYFFVTGIIVLISCKGRHALPQELPMFVNEGEEKLWLMNGFSRNSKGKERHNIALISYDSKTQFAACYASEWNTDSLVRSGIRYSKNMVFANKTEFPLTINFPKTDSGSVDWNWNLGRKAAKLKFEQSSYNRPDLIQPAKVKIHYKNQQPFHLVKTVVEPEVYSIVLQHSKTKQKEEQGLRRQSSFNLSVFNRKDELLKKANGNCLIWLCFWLKNGTQVSCLLSTDNSNVLNLVGAKCWDSFGNIQENQIIKTAVIKEKYWTSLASGKSYPLGINLLLTSENSPLMIIPRNLNQEIVVKKSSFWMGAVEIFGSENKKQIGIGNMYIFTP